MALWLKISTREFFDKSGYPAGHRRQVLPPTRIRLVRAGHLEGAAQSDPDAGLALPAQWRSLRRKGNLSNLLTDPFNYVPGHFHRGPGTGKQLYKSDYSNIEPRVGFSWDPWGDGKTAVRGAFGIFHDRVFGNLFGNARGNPPFEQDYLQSRSTPSMILWRRTRRRSRSCSDTTPLGHDS